MPRRTMPCMRLAGTWQVFVEDSSDPIPGTTIVTIASTSSCEKWPREQDPAAFPYVPSLLSAFCLHLEVACR